MEWSYLCAFHIPDIEYVYNEGWRRCKSSVCAPFVCVEQR